MIRSRWCHNRLEAAARRISCQFFGQADLSGNRNIVAKGTPILEYIVRRNIPPHIPDALAEVLPVSATEVVAVVGIGRHIVLGVFKVRDPLRQIGVFFVGGLSSALDLAFTRASGAFSVRNSTVRNPLLF